MTIHITVDGVDEHVGPRRMTELVKQALLREPASLVSRVSSVRKDDRERERVTRHDHDRLRRAFDAGVNFKDSVNGDPSFDEWLAAEISGECQHPIQYRVVETRTTHYDVGEGKEARTRRFIMCERCENELETRYLHGNVSVVVTPYERPKR